MTEEYARALKRRTFIALVATLLSLVLLGAVMFWMWCRLFGPPEFMQKDNPMLSAQSAELQLDTGATAYWQETAYLVPAHSDLGELLHTGQWTSAAAFPTEKAELLLCFGELYELSLWSDGRAFFYNGYTDYGVKTQAYYTIPLGVVKELTAALTALPA
nr:hypothetical protein [uncultured Flavonifractor sp.]